MDFNKLFEEMARIPKVVEGAKERHAIQRDIEEAIVQFRPDFIEVHDMLDAFTTALENRYEQDLSDIHHEMRQLKEALEEAEATKDAYEADEMEASKWEQIRQQEEEEQLLNGQRVNDEER